MLSVALSTVDRADTLARTLEAFCTLQEPAGGWQLLVVDNGSVDDTPAVLASFSDRLPLRVFHYVERGKNRALNSIITHFKGDLVVLTDDDVIPAPDWLCQHRRLADEHPDVAVFGGPILPQWESAPPAWMVGVIPFSVCFAQSNPEWHEGPSPPGRIWGANMSVRASVFADGFRFDPHRGPRADSNRYLTGGETHFVTRLHEAGSACWFSHGPVVQHRIREEQYAYSWVMQRGFRFGRSKGARQDGLLPARGKALMHWLLLEMQCAVNSLRWACASAETWRARRDWQLNVERGRWYQIAQPKM